MFDRRQARNQAFSAAGTILAAVTIGLLGHFVSNRCIFFFVLACALPTVLILRIIRSDEIDYDVARGGKKGDKDAKPASALALLKDRQLVIFLVCAVMFHFANAAMPPLLGEMMTKAQGRNSMMFMSACVVTTQIVTLSLAAWTGLKAGSWGRKPLLLIAFGVLPVRAVLYTLAANPAALVAIEILDGVSGCIFGIVSVLVIADLTRGSGRFNFTLGVIGTASASVLRSVRSSPVPSCITLAPTQASSSWRRLHWPHLGYSTSSCRKPATDNFRNQPKAYPSYEHHPYAVLFECLHDFRLAWPLEIRSRLAALESDSGLMGDRTV
ncbi:MAG: MFS transporter [Verrucomicrobiia bacterium]